jgi:hypothetical protein
MKKARDLLSKNILINAKSPHAHKHAGLENFKAYDSPPISTGRRHVTSLSTTGCNETGVRIY